MTTLKSVVEERNQMQRRFRVGERILQVLRAVALALLMTAVWSVVQPQEQIEQLLLGGLTLVLALVVGWRRRPRQPVASLDLALALEMQYGKQKVAPLPTSSTEPLNSAWRDVAEADTRELRRSESRQLVIVASTLILPVVLAAAALPSAAPSFKLALREVSKVVERLNRGATLEVLQGAATEGGSKRLTITVKQPPTVELLAQNLIEIQVSGAASGAAPVVELRRRTAEKGQDPSVFQSFQMTSGQTNAEDGAADHHVIAFAVSEDVDLLIPTLNKTEPFAHLHVRQLPIPKVKLLLAASPEDPWPDDQPLPLRIQVHAENPLQTLHLIVKSDQKVSKELVVNVMTEDKFDLSTDYHLLLEPYVENDVADIEIVAEAIDRALPTPLVGLSEKLHLTTASAYGRYRQALQTLREVKAVLDAAVEKQAGDLPKTAASLVKKAAEQSEKSPFFDGMDRLTIHRFAGAIDELAAVPRAEGINLLDQAINDFLFEHEILDDRERDRDFFVAARALSRLVEADAAHRPAPLSAVLGRLRTFLNDRYERWNKRVARLNPKFVPSEWSEIRSKKPFHAMLNHLEKLDKKPPSPARQVEQLTALSTAVVEYRTWIQNLEAQEDKMREEEDRQRQEGLASARDTLKELQKRQGEVSAELDRADERPAEQLANQWPATRMKQNSNTKETHRLEGQMRSLSPTAASRIEAAAQAMEQSNEAGNSGNFTNAETNADLAGRLLRQAENAAQQSQQKRRSRGRRRRVTGDNYYGQSVVGGDVEIKREYQVDRRYREDILDEVQSSSYDEENRTLLENYLRHVIR